MVGKRLAIIAKGCINQSDCHATIPRSQHFSIDIEHPADEDERRVDTNRIQYKYEDFYLDTKFMVQECELNDCSNA